MPRYSPETQGGCLSLLKVLQESGQPSHCERGQSLPDLPLQPRLTWFSGAGFLPYPQLEYLRKYEGHLCMADIYMAEGFTYRALETLQLEVGCLSQSRCFVIQPWLLPEEAHFSSSPFPLFASPPFLFYNHT